MANIDDIDIPSLTFVEGAAPSTPAAGKGVIYQKADGLFYSKDDAGNETLMSSGLATSTTTPPTFVAAGASASGTGAVVPAIYAGAIADDIIVLVVQSDNQTATAPATYTQMGPEVGIGTAGAAGGTRLAAFWKRHTGTESDPTVADTGDHTIAFTFGIRGCPTSGDPFRNVGATRKTTASTTSTGSAGATPADNCLIVQLFATALDSASAAFSVPTNASLTSVTEQVDVATADGNGGGIGLITGLLATAGSFVATTATVTSTVDVGLCFYFLPAGFVNRGEHIDRQIFTTAGFADTWTKPSGAKRVKMVAIGGGASGSAGRNAATAAGGGGGGGGGYNMFELAAADLPATLTVTAGAGGAATAHVDGTASNVGAVSTVTLAGALICQGARGNAAGASGSGSGGLGGNGGGAGSATAAGVNSYALQPTGGGTGGTTAGDGGGGFDIAGGAGAGGGTSQAASSGGFSYRGGGGGGGGRSNTNVGSGGASVLGVGVAGGATAGAAGVTSGLYEFGGSGGAGGTSTAGTGGAGGWPGGGGGGGGSQSGAQGGGAGADGVVVITTWC